MNSLSSILFTRSADGVLTEAEVTAIEDELLRNPEAGDIIPGTGGVRKIRAAISGRGKRGGARVLYHYVSHMATVFLIAVYAKNQASTLSESGKRVIKKLTAILDRE